MANANLFQQYLQPARSVQDYTADMDRADMNALTLVAQRRQNDLADLQAQQTRASLADATAKRNAVQRIYADLGPNSDPMARARALQADPLTAAEGMAAEKEILAANKTAADTKKTDSETLAKHLEVLKFLSGGVMANPTPQAAASALGMFERLTGIESPEERQAVAALQTPEQVKRWAAAHALQADKLLPQIQTRNTGGSTDTLAVDPLSGKVAVTNSVRNTQSPDSVASAAVQMRGQNMADARAREATATSLSRPFEVTGPDGKPMLVQQDRQGRISPVEGFGPKAGASKPLNDTQAKALLFGSRMREADKLLQGLAAKGEELPSIVKQGVEAVPLIGGGLGMLANVAASPQQQQVEQAQRDFVNAVLRRESGAAISATEFDNARKQYFPQLGDSPQVKQQKAANRDLAIRGMLAEVPEGQRQSVTTASPAGTAAPDVDALVNKYRSK